MQAVQFSEYGDSAVLHTVEVEEPHPGPGQIRIAVHAAGLNALDWKLRAGHLQEMMPVTLPAGIGVDAAGVVDEIGQDVDGVALGDAVFGSGSATYAEHAVLTSWAPVPPSLTFTEAAGYPVPVETAIRVLTQVGIRSGQTLLVSGAAGGVGSAVLQFARDRGIGVIGTASAPNQDYLRSLGATATVYGPGLVDRVRALAPAGVDAALDLAGSGVIAELIELTGDPAKVLSIADFTAPSLGAQVSGTTTEPVAAFAEAARLFTTGAFHMPVQHTYTLDTAAEAQDASAAGHIVGRLIISIT